MFHEGSRSPAATRKNPIQAKEPRRTARCIQQAGTHGHLDSNTPNQNYGWYIGISLQSSSPKNICWITCLHKRPMNHCYFWCLNVDYIASCPSRCSIPALETFNKTQETPPKYAKILVCLSSLSRYVDPRNTRINVVAFHPLSYLCFYMCCCFCASLYLPTR